MKIELGKIYENKTKMFLSPALKALGTTFTSKFSGDIFKLAYGIRDRNLDGTKIIEGRHPIFILCDKGINPQKCFRALEFMTHVSSYITEYDYDLNGRKHMLVLDFPEEFHNAYDMFLQGRYSEMYQQKDLLTLFPDKSSIAYKILTKDISYMPIFIKKIEELFNVEIEDKKTYITTELEFTYNILKETEENEVFNY